ncbi:Pr6Pr family membrane protein [Agromyces archimandritae]|uniref:Pr6Pr family membrane protein n=1 Tax=Agromyces archimandritae TaxID=2781962 RepID=A0A975FLC0_9MICO|nr:Pr6Pr family membrane protein [Agromyces archimandritae]QTX04049.1 Pr6Pr family membrane protein [Agromyces archimandritae]
MRGWIGERGGRRLRRALGVTRLVLAALAIAALVANFRYVLGFRSFAAENFFSYFTVQSAFFAIGVLIVSGIRALTGAEQRVWLHALRAAVTSYTLVSGIVFGIIAAQASTRDYRVDVPWSDVLLHFVVPAALLVDWAIESWLLPHTRPIPRRAVLAAVPFPVVWLVFTLMRGAEVGWYPYFFLDPYEVGGWPGILVYCTLVLAILLAVTWMLVQLNRVGTRRGAAARVSGADAAAPAPAGVTP